MSEQGNIVELWGRYPPQDTIVEAMLAAGFSEHQARWHSEQARALIKEVPQVGVTLPNCTEEQRKSVEALTTQIEAMQGAYRGLINLLLVRLYDALWPPGPGGGSRKAA